MKHYQAPWSTSLIVISALTTALCLAATVFMITRSGVSSGWSLLPLALVVGALPFTIRGYTLTAEAILVHRLLWATRLPLSGLQSARFEPNAMRGSLRVFGNGGLFSATGWFYNRRLGFYRAFVTDPHRTVILRYAKRTMAVSPDAPEEFVRDLSVIER